MLIYIHGYNSSGLSAKARHYQRAFGREQVFSPTLPTDSRLALDTLEQLIEQFIRLNGDSASESLGLIGSSLGGFGAVYLAELFQLPAVLINPAIPPWGRVEATTRPGSFVWEAEMLKRLAPFRVETPSRSLQSRICLLQQLDDEVLDPKLALDYLPDAQVHTGVGGGHRLTNVADYDEIVRTFFGPFGCLKNH